MTVGELKQAIINVPDEMELVVGIQNSQDSVYDAYVAYPDNNGMYGDDDECSAENGDACFFIDG